MRIGFTGGGTGGHFYPLISIAQKINEKYKDEKIHLYYFGPNPYDIKTLKENNIQYINIPAGKSRLYSSIENFFDYFKIIRGIFLAMLKLPIYYPDVIFSKGGFASYPVLFAAQILKIPVVIHDSDSIPGRVSIRTAKYAKLVAISWSEAGNYFLEKVKIPEEKIYETGLPIRKILNPIYKLNNIENEMYQKKIDTEMNINLQNQKIQKNENKIKINKKLPLILVLGGSLGSQKINEYILASLSILLPFAQVIHQTGKTDFEITKKTSEKLLERNPNKENYFCKDFFDEYEMRLLYENSSIIVMRSGSQILETYTWGIPTILIPINQQVSRDQTSNAFASMRRGASIVIEENNLSPHILQNEILKLLQDNKSLVRMAASARAAAKYDADEKLADILYKICKSHNV